MGACSSTGTREDAKPLAQSGRPRSDSVSRKELKPEPMGACGGCCRLFADAWRFDNFDLDLEGADWHYSFSTSRIFSSSGTLLALRFLIAAGMTVVLSFSMDDYSDSSRLQYWPIYFSSWTNILVVLYTWMSFVTHILALVTKWPEAGEVESRTPWFVTFTWLLYSLALPSSAISLVLSFMGYTEGSNHKVGQVLLVHWGAGMLMAVSLFLNNYSYHMVHATFPMLLVLAYILFTYVYATLGGGNPRGGSAIYHGFDWTADELGLQLPLTLLCGALINAVVWALVTYVRHIVDDDAWARIAAQHSKSEDVEANKGGKA